MKTYVNSNYRDRVLILDPIFYISQEILDSPGIISLSEIDVELRHYKNSRTCILFETCEDLLAFFLRYPEAKDINAKLIKEDEIINIYE